MADHKRIVFVGSFSTGKTTLAERLSHQLELPLLPEVAREIAALGFKLDKDATPEIETLIFLRQLNNEMSTPQFVGDRSLIDALAYARWVLDNRPRTKENALWDECERLAERSLRGSYSHVYYLPIEFPIVVDDLRPDDPEFQADIDKRILDLLHSHGLEYQTLIGSIEDRVAKVLADLG